MVTMGTRSWGLSSCNGQIPRNFGQHLVYTSCHTYIYTPIHTYIHISLYVQTQQNKIKTSSYMYMEIAITMHFRNLISLMNSTVILVKHSQWLVARPSTLYNPTKQTTMWGEEWRLTNSHGLLIIKISWGKVGTMGLKRGNISDH